jgi:uncharacterized membrane protein (DUF4010 family)
MHPEWHFVAGIAIAALGGAAVGVERQWSGHASGPEARFAGIRTFTLLGGLAGIAGWLWSQGFAALAAVLTAGAAALVVAAYLAASRRDVDGTTEVAALVVIAAGVAAGLGHLQLASGVIAITALLLVEKSRLHSMVERIDATGLRAGFRFAVMAVVVLPLLPAGPYGPLGGMRPRELWAMVLFFSGLSFAGYVGRQLLGARHGYPAAGLLGGLVSSTFVTLTFARASRKEHDAATPLALGVIAACTVLNVRVLAASAVLNAELAGALLLYLLAPFLAGAVFVLFGLRKIQDEAVSAPKPDNPLQFIAALGMAALFQAVLFGVYLARERFGDAGVLASGAVLGLTDLDALTISMAKNAAVESQVAISARAVAIGILSNTALKLAAALALGRGPFRVLAGMGLAAIAAASAVMIGMLWA